MIRIAADTPMEQAARVFLMCFSFLQEQGVASGRPSRPMREVRNTASLRLRHSLLFLKRLVQKANRLRLAERLGHGDQGFVGSNLEVLEC
jgi:hypothetical protein